MADRSAKELTLEVLQDAVVSAAAFRSRRRLQPAGGEGDKVFPPTFAGAEYAIERRRVPGRAEPVKCVLLDSVQSQANRMEQALQDAVDARKVRIPVIEVDFTNHDPTGDVEADKENGRLVDAVGKVTSLQVPHRLADAILRDSDVVEEKNGNSTRIAFRKSDIGKALNTVSPANATPLFELCPTALIFGMWDSTGPKGGLGPKFERAMVSEIVGIGVEVGDLRRGVRRDPLEVRSAVKVAKAADTSWSLATNSRGAVSPSEVNHSSVPFPKQRREKTDDNYYDGATIEYAEQTTTLSLICLRRLRFPVNGEANDETDEAARVVLAALGLCAATLAFDGGIGLRSRCLLWPDGPMEWELLERPGDPPEKFSLTGEQAVNLLKTAVDAAKAKRLPWREEPVVLKPSIGEGRRENLVELVRLSQLEATREGPDQGS
ncbi:MAG TPA: type I-U CRISPR-associated protein Cas7 [Polyangiaceae bacterium]|nr:type I-U CRISPR-associated protein Cas7 [Polyangiaceae bacterium]